MYLPACLYAYNTSQHEAIGDSPFFLTYGREPVFPPDITLLPATRLSNSVDIHRTRILEQLQTARALAKENIQKAQYKMKMYYDETSKDHPFKVGHRVWIYTPVVKTGYCKKLTSFWRGPFRLIEKTSPFIVCLVWYVTWFSDVVTWLSSVITWLRNVMMETKRCVMI